MKVLSNLGSLFSMAKMGATNGKVFIETIEENFSESSQSAQEFELLSSFKIGNGSYQEFISVDGNITQINYWSNAAKTLKLFTKDITYVDGNPVSIILKDEISNKILTTTIAYFEGEVINITKIVT